MEKAVPRWRDASRDVGVAVNRDSQVLHDESCPWRLGSVPPDELPDQSIHFRAEPLQDLGVAVFLRQTQVHSRSDNGNVVLVVSQGELIESVRIFQFDIPESVPKRLRCIVVRGAGDQRGKRIRGKYCAGIDAVFVDCMVARRAWPAVSRVHAGGRENDRSGRLGVKGNVVHGTARIAGRCIRGRTGSQWSRVRFGGRGSSKHRHGRKDESGAQPQCPSPA